MNDVNIKIIGGQQAANCEFKMRSIKPGCINYGTAVCEFQQPTSWRFAMPFPQEERSTPKQRKVIKLVT